MILLSNDIVYSDPDISLWYGYQAELRDYGVKGFLFKNGELVHTAMQKLIPKYSLSEGGSVQ